MACAFDPSFDPYGENSASRKTNVSFAVFGVELDPDELTERTGLKPSRGLSKGQEICLSQRAGGGSYPAPQGVWEISSDTAIESSSTESHARYIVDLLEPHARTIELRAYPNNLRFSYIL